MHLEAATPIEVTRSSGAFPYLIAMLFTPPINVTMGTLHGKPLDFVLSDVVWLLLPLIILLNPRVTGVVAGFFCLFLYFPVLGMIGAISQGGALGPIVSSMSFFMPAIHLLTGALINRHYGDGFLKVLARVIAVTVLLIAASDILYGSFPRGCGYEGRWGGCLGALQAYGFPNSSMNFLALAMFLPACLWSLKADRNQRVLLIAAFVMIIPMALLSLSRSAVLIMLVLLTCFAVQKTRLLFAPILISIALIVALQFRALLDLSIFAGLGQRMRIALEQGDLSNGRLEIGRETLQLIIDRPVFGYMFDYYSNYSDFGTTHQQFTEVLFKSGLLGFGIYFFVISFFWWCGWKMISKLDPRARRISRIYLCGFLFAVILSAMTQPILTYQPAGSLIFLLGGFTLQRFYKGQSA